MESGDFAQDWCPQRAVASIERFFITVKERRDPIKMESCGLRKTFEGSS